MVRSGSCTAQNREPEAYPTAVADCSTSWDTEPNAISYRAPLASGMLGLHPGDKTVVELPAGPLPIEILSARPFVHV